MLKLSVLDDDPQMIEQYENIIPEWFKKNNLNGELVIATTSHTKFLEEIKSNTTNVCIIDINLKDNVNGMYIAEQIRKSHSTIEIIFVTGCLDFIQRAFEVRAYQFIQKPDMKLLEETIVKLSNEKESLNQDYVEIKCNSEIYFIPINDINFIERLKRRTILHARTGDFVTYEGLEDLASRIGSKKIKRCHRSVFVNSDKIYCIDLKRKIITLQDSTTCDIGPKFFSDFHSTERIKSI